jgi:CysZ protein
MAVQIPSIRKSGVNYFLEGFQLIKQPGLRAFVFIPLMINLIYSLR